MKIAIIGAGAMGSLFGGLLSLAGDDVWLVDIWEEHIRTIREKGLTIRTPAGELTARPHAVTDYKTVGPADYIIVFVKSSATHAAALAALPLLGRDTAVLTLQNGYGNAEVIAGVVGAGRVLAGTTAHGATMLGPGRVLHGGKGETHIGALDGGNGRAAALAACLSRAGISTVTETAILNHVWGKLVINAGINALTGITGALNGRLTAFAETRELLALAVTEAVAVAAAAGIRLPYPDPVAKVAAVAEATASNRSSLLQDLRAGRPTEIDVINGAIVREGERLGIATPVNRTLTLLVKFLEKTSTRAE